jgi:hypothetical protein
MSPGAVAAILYSRCRLALFGFQLESEAAPGPAGVTEMVSSHGEIHQRTSDAFIVTASWVVQYGSDSRTYSSILAIDERDLVKMLRHVLARAAENGIRTGS